MSKGKKILAVLLTVIMTVAMAVTAFAEGEPSATITVNNLDADATLTYLQIIAPDPTQPTGWTFVKGAADKFKEVDSLAGLTDQQIIWKMIKYADLSSTVPEGTVAITATELQEALGKVESLTYGNDYINKNIITVYSAGVYAIKATTTNTKQYVYTPMSAYISFGGYDTTTGAPTTLASATVNAKKTTLNIEKKSNETDGVVEIGKEVTYTVKTTVPYIPDDVDSVIYKITDTIEGASYVKNNEDTVDVSVKIGTDAATTYKVSVKKSSGNKDQIVIDLSDVAADRNKANASVVITYNAIVTSEVVNNSVIPSDGTHTYDPYTNILYTGKITMTKTGEDREKLANAGFVVYRTVNNKMKYALVTKDTAKNNNEYVVTGWTEELSAAKATANLIITDSNGQAVIRGLDDSYTYSFKEVKAPQGYSINDTDSNATWGSNQQAPNRTGTASMTDTKLANLPSTGGIGTTIFTVAGCLIMICAAAFLFASRRRFSK